MVEVFLFVARKGVTISDTQMVLERDKGVA
jgi:hypothetical protein